MKNTNFNIEYEKNWLPLAHVLGVIGNGIFIFICWYEYDILYRLWGSWALAIVVPPFLELLQWFFAKIAVKQRIFEEQQKQLKMVNDHMTDFSMAIRDQRLRDGEREDFIDKNNLLLLRGGMIPPSAINEWLIYSFVLATLVASTVIITFNRNESNQKVIDMEVEKAKTVLDSINNSEIELKTESHLADINLIAVTGSVDVEKSNALTSQVQEIDNEITDAKSKKEVNRVAKLKKDRKNLTEKFNSLPLSKEYEKQKADKTKNFAAWKLKQEDINKGLKMEKEKVIREKYSTKGTRINWLAIITNILYVIFQYVIVKVRTITGSWSWDLIEFIGKGITPKPLKEETVMEEKNEENTSMVETVIMPEKKTAPSVETTMATTIETTIEKVETTRPTTTLRVVKDTDTEKPKQAPSVKTATNTADYENSRHKVYYETMKLSHLQLFFEENNITSIAGYASAEQIWSALKNGRKAIIAGKTESKSVQTMNNLLEKLADNYGIVVNPHEKTIETITPQLVKRIIESKSKIS